MTPDPITLADEAEERSAADALLAAKDKAELISSWWRDCDRFEGAARERLQDIYATRLLHLGVLQP